MSSTIQPSQWSSFVHGYQESFFNFFSTDLTKRIKETVVNIFSQIFKFFKAFDNQSNEINIKAVAMVSCLCLIGILIISNLKRDENLVPATPNPAVLNRHQVQRDF